MAWASVTWPCPFLSQHLNRRLPYWKPPVHASGIWSSSVASPACRASTAVASFQMEPGAYVPLMALL